LSCIETLYLRGIMIKGVWWDGSENPRQFEAWLKANAVVGSIIAIGIRAMASPDFLLASLYPDPDHPPDTPIWGFTRQWRSASTDGPQLEAVWRDALIKCRLFPQPLERWCSIR
jgi:hypothetical protein